MTREKPIIMDSSSQNSKTIHFSLKTTYWDVVLSVIILILIGCSWFFLIPWRDNSIIIIKTPYEKIRLKKDQSQERYPLKGKIGVSYLRINSQEIRFLESPCVNKYCIHQGNLLSWQGSLACVPNEILVFMQSSEVDAVAY